MNASGIASQAAQPQSIRANARAPSGGKQNATPKSKTSGVRTLPGHLSKPAAFERARTPTGGSAKAKVLAKAEGRLRAVNRLAQPHRPQPPPPKTKAQTPVASVGSAPPVAKARLASQPPELDLQSSDYRGSSVSLSPNGCESELEGASELLLDTIPGQRTSQIGGSEDRVHSQHEHALPRPATAKIDEQAEATPPRRRSFLSDDEQDSHDGNSSHSSDIQLLSEAVQNHRRSSFFSDDEGDESRPAEPTRSTMSIVITPPPEQKSGAAILKLLKGKDDNIGSEVENVDNNRSMTASEDAGRSRNELVDAARSTSAKVERGEQARLPEANVKTALNIKGIYPSVSMQGQSLDILTGKNGCVHETLLLAQLAEIKNHQINIQKLMQVEKQSHLEEIAAWEKRAYELADSLAEEPAIAKAASEAREERFSCRLESCEKEWQCQVATLRVELASLQLQRKNRMETMSQEGVTEYLRSVYRRSILKAVRRSIRQSELRRAASSKSTSDTGVSIGRDRTTPGRFSPPVRSRSPSREPPVKPALGTRYESPFPLHGGAVLGAKAPVLLDAHPRGWLSPSVSTRSCSPERSLGPFPGTSFSSPVISDRTRTDGANQASVVAYVSSAIPTARPPTLVIPPDLLSTPSSPQTTPRTPLMVQGSPRSLVVAQSHAMPSGRSASPMHMLSARPTSQVTMMQAPAVPLMRPMSPSQSPKCRVAMRGVLSAPVTRVASPSQARLLEPGSQNPTLVPSYPPKAFVWSSAASRSTTPPSPRAMAVAGQCQSMLTPFQHQVPLQASPSAIASTPSTALPKSEHALQSVEKSSQSSPTLAFCPSPWQVTSSPRVSGQRATPSFSSTSLGPAQVELRSPRAKAWQVLPFAPFDINGINLRREKSKSSAKIGYAPRGSVIHGTREGDWIRLSNGAGYCMIRDGLEVFLLESGACSAPHLRPSTPTRTSSLSPRVTGNRISTTTAQATIVPQRRPISPRSISPRSRTVKAPAVPAVQSAFPSVPLIRFARDPMCRPPFFDASRSLRLPTIDSQPGSSPRVPSPRMPLRLSSIPDHSTDVTDDSGSVILRCAHGPQEDYSNNTLATGRSQVVGACITPRNSLDPYAEIVKNAFSGPLEPAVLEGEACASDSGDRFAEIVKNAFSSPVVVPSVGACDTSVRLSNSYDPCAETRDRYTEIVNNVFSTPSVFPPAGARVSNPSDPGTENSKNALLVPPFPAAGGSSQDPYAEIMRNAEIMKNEILASVKAPYDSPPCAPTLMGAEELLANALCDEVRYEALVDAVIVCHADVCGLDLHAMRRLGSAEERLRGRLDHELRLASGLLADSVQNAWPKLRKVLLYCIRLRMTDLQSFQRAGEQAAKLQLDPLSFVDPILMAFFQRLFDCMRMTPSVDVRCPRLVVERVIELEPGRSHAKYALRKGLLAQDCKNIPRVRVRSQDTAWAAPFGLSQEPLCAEYNEFYLFYSAGVERIGENATHLFNDFNTFGHNVSLAEYASHACHLAAGTGRRCCGLSVGRRAIVVCRAFCGQVRDVGRCSPTDPLLSELREPRGSLTNLEQKPHHSIMCTSSSGSCADREFVLPIDQVLPEFVIFCHDDFNAHPPVSSSVTSAGQSMLEPHVSKPVMNEVENRSPSVVGVAQSTSAMMPIQPRRMFQTDPGPMARYMDNNIFRSNLIRASR